MEKPHISVVIPTLNEEKVLERTLSQFTPELCEKFNIEVIVSDGGSNDATVSIAEKRAHRVVVHSEPRRQTIAEGRNKGAHASRGNILVFLDADVIIHKIEDFFHHVHHFSDTKHVFMTGNVHVHPHEETPKDRLWHHVFNFTGFIMQRTSTPAARGELQIIKKEIFMSVGGYREDIIASEDCELAKRVRKKGTFCFNRHITVFESPRRYRKHGYLGVLRLWHKNYYSVLFTKKSASKEWEVVR